MPFSAIESDEADELFENDESDESDEAARRTWSRPKVATGKDLFKPRPQGQYVTQAQLETALAKVGQQVRTNSTAISQTNSRVAAASMAVKKETENRKKDMTSVRSSLSQTQQVSAILPLLSQPSSVKVSGLATDGIPDGTQVLVNSSNTLGLLLPMLLLTGIGTGDSTTGGSSGGMFGGGGGDNSSMMMMMLVLALGNK